MLTINIVEYNNSDFIQLCNLLEKEHIDIIREQRSPKGNCLNNLSEFKYIFVAYNNQQAIGCVAMKAVKDSVAELGRLYVLPEYRKHGIATKLFEMVEKQAKKNGAKKIILDTYKRFDSAIKLYKKLGFNEINNYIENSPYSICLEKRLI